MITALLIFLSSSVWGSIAFLAFAAIWKLPEMKKADWFTPLFKIIFLIVILSIVNYCVCLIINGGIFITNSNTPYPYALSMVLAYILAKTMTINELKWLLLFIIVDVAVGILEYKAGVASFWETEKVTFESNSDVLYFKRVCGMDTNSSVFGLNILIGLIILYFVKPKYSNLIVLFFAIGLFCSFNRTYILASTPLFGYYIYRYVRQKGKIAFLFLSLIVIVSFIYVYVEFGELILTQFLRGGTKLNSGVLTHRDSIWSQFIAFFMDHPLTGNGSIKMLLDNGWHAHNSFIWVLASNGFIIAILYYYYTLRFITKENVLPIFCMLLASITQAFLYWGLSLPDIILFWIILLKYPPRIIKFQW